MPPPSALAEASDAAEMNEINELFRLDSPAPKPQSLAWDGTTLWMGSRETQRVYAIDPDTWTAEWEAGAPGTPWGMTAVGRELRVLCGETSRDRRVIRRCVPGSGFDPNFALPCPEGTGSQLSWDGRRLHLTQWYLKKLVTLGEKGEVQRTIDLPRGVCGQVAVEGVFFLVTTEDENGEDCRLTRVDPSPSAPKIEDLARIPFAARALAFDGSSFWTNHRDRNQIVRFIPPAAVIGP